MYTYINNDNTNNDNNNDNNCEGQTFDPHPDPGGFA